MGNALLTLEAQDVSTSLLFLKLGRKKSNKNFNFNLRYIVLLTSLELYRIIPTDDFVHES